MKKKERARVSNHIVDLRIQPYSIFFRCLAVVEKDVIHALLIKVKEEHGKAGLKLNIQKTKIITSSPIPHGK